MLKMQETSEPARNRMADDALTWQERAHCKGLPTRIFFHERGRNDWMLPTSTTICAACPVRIECLTHAMLAGEHDGMWGGHTEQGRRGVRSRGRANGHYTVKDQILAFGGLSHQDVGRLADYVRIADLLPGHTTVDHHRRKHAVRDVVEIDEQTIAVCWVPGRYVALPASLHVWRLKP
jgi:WhiB family redox-sensing transcriptional regulator